MINLTILGCHSATPRVNAFPTSQYLEINNNHFLIDCGEGTQRQMRKYKVGFSKINHIFISHLHGDHFYGLVGLLSTYGILSREKEMHIFGPKGIKAATLQMLKVSESHAKFNMIFHELSSKKSELIYEDEKVTVHTIPLTHRVYTNGYLFKEKEKPRKLNMLNISGYPEIDKADYLNIKAGRDVQLASGEVISNSAITLAPSKALSFAFCSDTSYKPDIVPIIKDVDLLYHEATFLADRQDLAKKTKHSTSIEAAQIAKEANVGQLVVGHYSGRYPDTSLFQKEAETVFKNVALAKPGAVFTIN
ncbi:ribonuclease Z [uncultured Polaribacter sp.]|uniref:ribonuclease Z n=1 Tax=uncultured Polaribacter sp. TaxID=174711 RepID=UPI000B26C0BC|nr:ribonuclease Z [Polaribacter sp.]|tara:strand:- start:879 stop:1793 length:915 start_codon:yes stop_codon:yes gene_type:complete